MWDVADDLYVRLAYPTLVERDPMTPTHERAAIENDVYYAMAEQARRLLVQALDRDGRVPLKEAVEEYPDHEAAWYHSHLPRLKTAGVIAYDDSDPENGVDIVPGPRFDAALALLDGFEESADTSTSAHTD